MRISILIDLGDGTTLTEFARVTVVGVNDMPSANPDSAATGEGAAVTIDVLNNDTDPDNNDVLSISSASITSGAGTVTISGDGKSLIYDPAGAFDFLSNDETGTVVIAYQVTDSQGGSATGTATVVVSGSNTEPSITAADTMGTVTELPDGEGGENSTILTAEGSIAFTDTDLGDSHQATVLPSPGSFRGTLTAQITDSATGDGTGQVTWLFSVSDADLEDLAANGKLLQNYTVRITDSSGAVITQVVTITIQGSNDGPVLVGGTLQGSVTELADNAPGEGTQIHQSNGGIAFFDADLTGSHSVAVAANGSGYLGSVVASVTSSSQIAWTYSVADGALDYLAAGQSLTQSYTVTITDSTGASIIQVVTVTINGTNDAPVITSGPGTGSVSAQIDADDLSTSGQLNFADVDLNDTHTVSVDADGAGFRGALTAGVSNASTGDGSGQISWTYLINNGDIEDLADGQLLIQTYTITLEDVNGATSTQKVTITIGGTNDTPVITGGPGSGSVTELPDGDAGENSLTLSASGTIGFTDLDLADTHTVSVIENGSGFLGTLSPNISNTSFGDGTGQISWSFTVNDSDLDFLSVTDTRTQTYTLTLRDNNGATDTQTVTITINGSNDAPIITTADVSGGLTELADGAAGENSQTLSVAGSFAFSDVDANDGHTASVTAIGAAPRGSLTAIVSGLNVLWTYAVSDGALNDLAQSDTVIQSYMVTVNDGHGGTDSRIVDISLTGTNDVAIITGKSTGLVIEDDEIDTISGLLKVEDPDIRQDGTREDAFKAVVIAGTYGTLTMAASGQWSYELDNYDPDTSALTFSDTVSDNFTISTIDGTTHEISVTVEGAGFDFEFSDFSGNSGSSQFKTLDAGTIQSVDIDLLITPMPLMVGDGSHANPNKVNASSFDLGVGHGQDIDSTEGLRFEFVTRAQAPSQNDIAALTYVSHIALVVFQAQINGIQGNDGSTASILIRIVNADDDKNFDSLGDDGSDANGEADIVIPLSVNDVTVNSASGYTIQQFGDTVVISGLQQGDTFTVESPTPFNRVEVENASEITSQGNEFELGVLGFNMAQASTDLLNGGDGNDTLASGAGQQVLTGGKGIDAFVFDGNMSTGELADIIADYQQGIDVIDLTALFDLAPGAFSEASVQEFARYVSPNDNDGGSDPSGASGDLFVDLDGAGTSQSFALVAHLNTAPDNVILKVDDGNEINYVTVI